MKKKPLVILDFDGTLAPIVSDPENARIDAENLENLQKVSKEAKVAILTGRPASFVKRQVGPKIRVLGLHGNKTDAMDQGIEGLKKRAIRLFGKNQGVVEEKPLGFALHYRNAPTLKRSLARFAKTAGKGIRVLKGRKAFEFLPASVRVKAETLESIVKRNPKRRVLFIGDDNSDLEGILRMQKYPNFTGVLVKSREVSPKGAKTISRSELFSFIENFISGNPNEEKA